ncbi:MAG TPA: alpha/beta fold hydrolase [Solirubrobacteraceae bacterium]|nr:alpha/beta fold hydrolase [Solirubrobacteraceae bacterium]
MPEVAYTISGQESGRAPLLLTHGFGASRAMWAPNLDALGAKRRVITWDLPGHGASSAAGELSHDRCIADMLELLDELPTERAVIGGMSLGGYLSLLLCARHPERVAALLLVDSGPGFRDDAAREGWNAWVAALADELDARGPGALREGPESINADHAAGGAGLAAAARAILTQRDAEAFESLERVAAPTLVVVGAEDDRFLPAAEAMTRRIPGARKVVLEEAGHAANMDQPAEFDRVVNGFLEEL